MWQGGQGLGAGAEGAGIVRAGRGRLGYLGGHQSAPCCLPQTVPTLRGATEEEVRECACRFVPTLTQQAAPTGPAGEIEGSGGGIFGARQDDWAVSEGPEHRQEPASQLSLTAGLVPTGHLATQMKDSPSRQGSPGGRLGWGGERPGPQEIHGDSGSSQVKAAENGRS